jgi:hypothetical protein
MIACPVWLGTFLLLLYSSFAHTCVTTDIVIQFRCYWYLGWLLDLSHLVMSISCWNFCTRDSLRYLFLMGNDSGSLSELLKHLLLLFRSPLLPRMLHLVELWTIIFQNSHLPRDDDSSLPALLKRFIPLFLGLSLKMVLSNLLQLRKSEGLEFL